MREDKLRPMVEDEFDRMFYGAACVMTVIYIVLVVLLIWLIEG